MTFATITTHTFTDPAGRTFELAHGPAIHATVDPNASVEGCVEVRYLVHDGGASHFDPIADTDLADLEPWDPEGQYSTLEDVMEWVKVRKTRNVIPVHIGDGHGPFADARVCDDTADGFRESTHLLTLNHTNEDATRADHREWAASTLEEWQRWADGEVYGVVRETFDAETLERIAGDDWPSYDACWGFIGLEYATESCDSGNF